MPQKSLILRVLSFLGQSFGVLVVMTGGLLFLLAGLHGLDPARARYLPVEAEVTDLGDFAASRNTPNEPYFVSTHIGFRYSVDGREYQGLHLLSNKVDDPQQWEAAARQRYASGAVITVYYDPEDPSQNAWQGGQDWGGLAILSFGILFLGMFPWIGLRSVVGWVFGRRSHRRAAEALRWFDRITIVLATTLALTVLAGALFYGWSSGSRLMAIFILLTVLGLAGQYAHALWKHRRNR